MSETSVVLMRNSERVSFRRCGFKWDLSYNRRLQPKRLRSALEFGSLIHASLEGWYPTGKKRGVHPAETFTELYAKVPQEFSQWSDDERVPALDLGVAMLEGYVNHYGEEEWMEVVSPELSMEIDILDTKGNYLCTWVGQGDLLIRDLRTGRYAWLEHKTSKDHVEDVPVISQYGDQGIAYHWAGTTTLRHNGVLGEDETVDYVQFNFLKKAMPDSRPFNSQGHALNKPSKDALKEACEEAGLSVRGTVADLTGRLQEAGWTEDDIAQLGEPSKNQPSPLFSRTRMDLVEDQLENFGKRIRHEAWMMAAARERRAPILKNPHRDCSWDCDFKDVCELHEMGGDYELILEYEFDEWDPYENHDLEVVK